jgi:hypothetical protein
MAEPENRGRGIPNEGRKPAVPGVSNVRESRSPDREFPGVETKDPEFPNINAMHDFDREAHVKRAMEAGASRKEAERHADEELARRDDAHR